MMKKIFMTVLIGLTMTACAEKEEVQVKEEVKQFVYDSEKEYVKSEYIITEKNGEFYVANSTEGDEYRRIYFDSDFSNDNLKKGDKIIAMYEEGTTESGTIDGLVEIYLKEDVQEVTYNPDEKIEFHDFTITRKDVNGFYFAESLQDETGVYFNYEYTNEDFEVGDLVVATFDTTKQEDNLTEVYLK